MKRLKDKTLKTLLLFFFIFLNYTWCLADEYHYSNILIGDRAAGLGGAYTAISDDSSGCYYNPAGIVFSTQRKLSVSVNAYHISTKTYEDVLPHTTGGAESWELKSSRLLPNFFGIIQKFGSGTIGFSYAVTDSVLRSQEQVFHNIKSKVGVPIERYVINIDDVDNTYNLGPSYAIKITNNLSTGATLYLYYRDGKIIRNHLLNLTDGTHDWENYYLSWKELGLRPILGFMWSPADKLSVGLTFSKTFLFSSEMRQQITTQCNVSGVSNCGSDVNFSIYKTDEKRRFPLTTTLGIAYFPSPALLFSADISYHTKVSDKEDVLNLAFGTEYYLSPSFALRGGIFTDLANTPELSATRTDQPEHINNYGITLSGTYFTRASSITLGGIYTYGTGEAQIISGDPTIQDATINSITIFMGASYAY